MEFFFYVGKWFVLKITLCVIWTVGAKKGRKEMSKRAVARGWASRDGLSPEQR